MMEKRLKDYFALMEMCPQWFRQSELVPIETDASIIMEYERETGKQVGIVYQSPYNTLVVDLIRKKEGGYYTYERMLPTVEKGAVVILTKCQDDYVLLKQYRHALRDYQYACPRGFGEEGISVEDNLKKEIQEEIGAQVLAYQHLGTVVADSGLCGNRADVFLCTVESVKHKLGYEGIQDVVLLDEKEMEQWIRDGKITDGFTLAAYGLYKTKCVQ